MGVEQMSKGKKRVVARWTEGQRFLAITGSGHEIRMDGAGHDNGTSHGASPMELLLAGMAGCTGIDVIDILKKKRQKVTQLEVEVEGVRAAEPPRVYTEIQVVFRICGDDISEKAVQDAIRLSETKYCSASIMLGKLAKITSRYEISEK
jgi:putative redox protein